jgi:hypothetical protein
MPFFNGDFKSLLTLAATSFAVGGGAGTLFSSGGLTEDHVINLINEKVPPLISEKVPWPNDKPFIEHRITTLENDRDELKATLEKIDKNVYRLLLHAGLETE